MLPKRNTKTRRRHTCQSHLKWVRGHRCCVPGCDKKPIEAAHVRSGTGGGMGMKPHDRWVISLCSTHHHEQHSIGERPFEKRYGIDMKALAIEFASRSPHRQKLDEVA